MWKWIENWFEDLWIGEFKEIDSEEDSLKNLNSLVISNNEELESIVTEDGNGGWSDESKNTGFGYYVKNVEISSIF